MSSNGTAGGYFWCLRHRHVETAQMACPENYRLGPYATEEDAERSLQPVADGGPNWAADDGRSPDGVS